MKKCKHCNQSKPLSEFYSQTTAKDGLMSKCKECAKEASRQNRARKIEYYREYDKNRFQNDPRVRARHKRYSATDAGREAHKKAHKKWKEKNPIKRAAHVITGNAIRDGIISKGACEVCGRTNVHAHHDDYAKPLDIRWLCPRHHKKWHDEKGDGANA